MGFGREQERFGGGDGGGGAVVGGPGVEEPGGGGEFGGPVGEGDGVAGDFAQDGVDEAGGGAFAGAFDEFDGGGDGGVGGDAVEVAELENAEAEGDADFGVELDGAAGEVVDEEVELELVAEAAEDELVGQAGFLGAEGGGVVAEDFIGPGSAGGAEKGVEGGGAGG